MTGTRLLLIASAAACLASAAGAQSMDPPAADTGASAMTPAPSDPNASAAQPTGAELNAAVAAGRVKTITNGPVADTPENRAKYGQPMSRTGQRTAPTGN